jgi:ribosomal protein L7/L12
LASKEKLPISTTDHGPYIARENTKSVVVVADASAGRNKVMRIMRDVTDLGPMEATRFGS